MGAPIQYPTGIIGTAAASGAAWVVASTLDWSAEPAVDLKAVGTLVDANGDTWTAANGAKASTLGTDGSTGLRIVASSNCSIASNNCPEVGIALSTLVPAVDDRDEVYVMMRVTYTTASPNGRVGCELDTGGTNIFGGLNYLASPGQLEFGGVTITTQWTDPNIATATDTDLVLGVLYRSGFYEIYSHGAWGGSWPTEPGTFIISDAEDAGSPKTATAITLTTAALRLLCMRASAPSPDLTFHGHRILHRVASP